LLFAFAASVITLVLILTGSQDVAVLLPHILEPTGVLIAVFLTYLNHTRMRTSATLILLFWPLYTISLVAWGRTAYAIHQGLDTIFMSLECSVALFGLASLALECLGPYDVIPAESGKAQVENPLLTANIFSKWVRPPS
jgi:ATP-binding cassette, subfamily C (CFTR/MRP), member 1